MHGGFRTWRSSFSKGREGAIPTGRLSLAVRSYAHCAGHPPAPPADAAGSVGFSKGATPRGASRYDGAVRSVLLACVFLGGCSAAGYSAASAPPKASVDWALALHGGAGTISREAEPAVRGGYEAALARALQLGVSMLEQGAAGMDVVETVIRAMEDDPLFNAGRGAVFTAEGRHELDASIMDGRTLSCGAVAGVTTVRHPITLARRVMEHSRHVLLSGSGAEVFASKTKVERVDNAFFSTERRQADWKSAKSAKREPRDEGGTVGVVVRDGDGHLVGGTSTGGMTYKRYGRVGDSPIIGAGTYADDRTVAVSCTGVGERFIERAIAYQVAARMRFAGMSLVEASRAAVAELPTGSGGLVAVDRFGRISMQFNTPGMYRAAADSTGLRQVGIWDEVFEPAP